MWFVGDNLAYGLDWDLVPRKLAKHVLLRRLDVTMMRVANDAVREIFLVSGPPLLKTETWQN